MCQLGEEHDGWIWLDLLLSQGIYLLQITERYFRAGVGPEVLTNEIQKTLFSSFSLVKI